MKVKNDNLPLCESTHWQGIRAGWFLIESEARIWAAVMVLLVDYSNLEIQTTQQLQVENEVTTIESPDLMIQFLVTLRPHRRFAATKQMRSTLSEKRVCDHL